MATALAGLAGCGNHNPQAPKLPAGAEAQVHGRVIGEATLARWLAAARRSAEMVGGKGAAMLPDAPLYRRCKAALRLQFRALGGPRPRMPAGQLMGLCQRRDQVARARVLQQLVVRQWIVGEAREQHISVGDAVIARAVRREVARRFRGRDTLGRYLRATGLSLADLRFHMRVQLLTKRLRERALAGASPVSSREVERFYRAHVRDFQRPARRDVLVVMTATRRDALRARAGLRRGASFARVARRMSVDPATRLRGGRMGELIEPSAPSAFERAVFAAKPGRLSGPVEVSGRFLVFRVTRTARAQRKSLASAAPTIRRLLAGRSRQQRLKVLADSMQRKWAGRTACARRSQCQGALMRAGL